MLPPPMRFLPLLMFLLLLSCNQEPVEKKVSDALPQKGSPEYYYAQSRGLKDREKKNSLLDKGLASIASDQDSMLVILHRAKALNYIHLKEYDSSLKHSTKFAEAARLQKDTAQLATAIYRSIWAYRELGQSAEMFRSAFRSKELFLSLGDSSSAGKAWYHMADAQKNSGDYPGSQTSATESLRLLDQEKDSSFISSAYNLIGISLKQQEFFKEAVREYQNALAFSSTGNESILNNIANALGRAGEYEGAIGILEGLLEREHLSAAQKAAYMDNLTYLRWRQHPELDVSEDLERGKEFHLKEGNLRKLQASYDYLAQFYTDRDQDLAKKYAEELLQAGRDYGNPQAELDALEKLVGLSPPQESQHYAQEYMRIRDSLAQDRLRNQHLFAKIQYDEEQKEKEILSLQTRTALQEVEMAEHRERNILLGSGMILLVLGGGFLLYFLRQRHQRQKLKEIYRTETRISKKVHDELANDVYTLMTQLEGKTEPVLVDQLEHIYQRTRNISRENSSISTGEDFGKELLSMLSHYTPKDAKLFNRGLQEIPWKKYSDEKQVVIYRVLQELMTNMKKHSGAKLVAVTFDQTPKGLLISYSDNGAGMDTETKKFRNGLRNVENRISGIRGNFTFESSKGKGVKATIKIPL